MKHIPVGKNHFAIVDDADFEDLSKRNWYLWRSSHLLYARANFNQDVIFMHRYLMNAEKGVEVDHINGNSLDNRRENLRLCTRNQQMYNRRKPAGCSSQYKGVFHCKKNRFRPWYASIGKDGVRYNLGYYETEEEAGRAYDKAALEMFGEFARLNFQTQKQSA